MESFTTWAATICVFSVVVMLYRVLFPEGNIKKTGETVIALLMLFVMLTPFFDMDLHADDLIPKAEQYDFLEMQEKDAHKAALEQLIRSTLLKNGIETSEIQLQAEPDSEQYLVLSALKLTVESETSDEAVFACLENELHIPKEIIEIGR